MKDSTKKIIFAVLVGLPTLMIVWIFSLYFFGCGTTNTCTGIPQPDLTPIPTLIAATLPAQKVGAEAAAAAPKCQIAALDLIGAWVTAGYKENDPFSFTDAKGANCTGTFKGDVQKLFVTPNYWYDGAPACTTCHYANIALATKNMDLSSYAGILAGSNRLNNAPKGNDRLGGGYWANALLHHLLFAPDGKTTIGRPPMPLGRPASVPASGPVISAGSPSGGTAASVTTPAAAADGTAVTPTLTTSAATQTAGATAAEGAANTPTPAASLATQTGEAPSAPGIPRPSNPGGAGLAITLTGDIKSGEQIFAQNCTACHASKGTGGIQNPGSTDGTVPALNPIDENIKNANFTTFVYNIDLFVEHGSTPQGTSPELVMTDWGDSGKLLPQQIADVIAYVISLNK